MIVLKRPVSILAFVGSFLLAEAALREIGGGALGWVIALAVAPLVYQWLLLPTRLLKVEFWALGVPLALMGIATAVVLLYVPGVWWQRMAGLAGAVLVGVMIETEFHYFFRQASYVPGALERVGELLLFIGAVGAMIGVLGLDYLDLTHKWVAVMMAVLLVLGMSASAVYLYHLPAGKRRWFFLLSGLLTLQLFWMVQFFPIAFVVSGSVIGVGMATLFVLLKHTVLESLDRKTLIRTLGTSSVAMALLLSTTRWV